jgi:hypothetical protein
MLFREYPLLNTPNMVAVILREASADGGGTLESCTERLLVLLDAADEHPPFGREDVALRLRTLIRYLTEARLVTGGEPGAFTLTARGRTALAEHPAGFDSADLMVYPEFARYIRGLGHRRGAMDPRAGGYDAGFYAYWSGEAPADNPYPPDTADHLAWENGWSEALDEDFRWPGPRHAPGR